MGLEDLLSSYPNSTFILEIHTRDQRGGVGRWILNRSRNKTLESIYLQDVGFELSKTLLVDKKYIIPFDLIRDFNH